MTSRDPTTGGASHEATLPSRLASGVRESIGFTKSRHEEEKSVTREDLIAREERQKEHRTSDPRQPSTSTPLSLTTQERVKLDPDHPMMALEWHGAKSMKIGQRARPMVTDPQDVVVRVTSTTICGSDLHMYTNDVPGVAVMKSGDILGHECMGIIDDVGPGVTNLKKGDRVVVSAVISCGQCSYCKNLQPSLCDTTNPSGQMEYLYGHRLAGILGYSHLTGGYSGGQAEYVRMPFGDQNCLKVPDGLTDQQVLLLSDVFCTGFHGCELGDVKEGQVVIVWGAGPIGMAAAYLSARLKKAGRVIIVDCIPARLQMALKLGLEVLDFSAVDDVTKEIQRRVPGGADVTIECVGFRFPRTWLHKFLRATRLESDSPEIIRAMVFVTKKGGNMAVIGDYFADANQFPLGQLMEKNITFRGGQVFIHRYWQYLLEKINDGTIDPTLWFTHTVPLNEAPEAYDLFNEKEDGVMKIQLLTDFGRTLPQNKDVHLTSLRGATVEASATAAAQ